MEPAMRPIVAGAPACSAAAERGMNEPITKIPNPSATATMLRIHSMWGRSSATRRPGPCRTTVSDRRGAPMRRGLRWALAAGMLLAGVALADSGWREIQGPHVVVRTDHGSGTAREAALA